MKFSERDSAVAGGLEAAQRRTTNSPFYGGRLGSCAATLKTRFAR